MRNYLSFFIAGFLFLSFTTPAQDLDLLWAQGFSDNNSIGASELVVDKNGNTFVIGSFLGTADFDPGPGKANFTTGINLGNWGSYFAKYDADGEYVFAYSMGDSGQVIVRDIELDQEDNIWITGFFKSTVDFDFNSGTANFTAVDENNTFVAQYDGDGNYIQAFTFSGGSPDDMTLDANGNILITGTFRGTKDFAPGPEIHNLVNTSRNPNIFLAKYSSSGDLKYAFSIQSTNRDRTEKVESVATDATGNAFLSGVFVYPIDLDPGSGTAIFSSMAGIDGFVAKYNTSGEFVSAFTLNGGANFLAVDGMNNLYVSGRMPDSMDVDPGPDVAMLYSENNFDVYFAKYDENGDFLHASVFESNQIYVQKDIAIDSENNFYLYGNFRDTVNFTPGEKTGILTSKGEQDLFLSKFDPSGKLEFAHSIGGAASDGAKTMGVGLQGNISIMGSFQNTVDFNLGTSIYDLVSPEGFSSFIAKYKDLTVTGLEEIKPEELSINIFSANDKLLIDFTKLKEIDADIEVFNLLGQTILKTHHHSKDMLQLSLPFSSSRICLVVVRNGDAAVVKKVLLK